MTDFASDGQPFETPQGAAGEGYAQTPPSLGSAVKAMALDSSPTRLLVGAVNRGQYAGSSAADQGLAAFVNQDDFGNPLDESFVPGGIKTPMLSAEEANDKYAPLGPDGKPAKITDQPIPDGVAQLVGRAKAREIERQGVLARFQNAHAWPVTLGTGVGAFLLDPLNAASTFLPGIGEETVAARLGGGFLARTVGRVAAGASAGAISQAPLTALKYGLGQEEASDYDLRSAFRDMGFAAAGGAVMQAGMGALSDVLRARRAPAAAEAPPEPVRAEAAEVISAPATAKADAMRAAVAQVAEGRPVDVTPVTEGSAPAAIAERQQQLARDGFAPGMAQGDFDAAYREAYGPEEKPEEGEPERAAEEPPPTLPEVPGATPYVPMPREPARLVSWLQANGGLKDAGGDVRHTLGGAKYRPGLVNNQSGMTLDDAALKAWEAGYFPQHGQNRPTVNDLLDAVANDLKGNARYSAHDEAQLAEHRAALAHNAEVDRLANDLGIKAANHTREQFFDLAAERMSTEEQAREQASLAAAHENALREAEEAAKAFVESRGEAWEPDEFYGRLEPRSLEDLENEYRQEEAARRAAEGEGTPGASRPTAGGEGGGEAGAGRGGNRAGPGRRDEAPGAGLTEQQPDHEMMAAEAALSTRERAQMLPEERAELDMADREAASAETTASAYQEAANCLSGR